MVYQRAKLLLTWSPENKTILVEKNLVHFLSSSGDIYAFPKEEMEDLT